MAAVLDPTVARMLMREEQATGAGVEVIRKLTTEVFPPHFYMRETTVSTAMRRSAWRWTNFLSGL